MPGPIPVPVIPSLDEFYAQRERIAMSNPLSPDAIEWGCVITPAKVAVGEPFWRIVEVAGPMDIGGNHHIYVDVWDDTSNRVVGLPVVFFSDKQQWTIPTESKKGEPYAVNMPMYAGGHAYGVKVGDGLPSDSVFGFGMPDHKPHHSFRVIFKRSAGISVGEPPEPPIVVGPGKPITLLEAIDYAQFYLNMVRDIAKGMGK